MTFSSTPPEDALPENSSEDAALLNAVLPPLLKDFQHWFGRSAELLETQEVTFLGPIEQARLLERVKDAKKQVDAAQALAALTEGQAGIEMPVVMSWHKLVHECWGVALRYRKENPDQKNPSQESQSQDGKSQEDRPEGSQAKRFSPSFNEQPSVNDSALPNSQDLPNTERPL